MLLTYVFVALVVTAGTAAQAASGFGFSLLTVPLLAALLDAQTAVVANGALGLLLVAFMAVRGQGRVERSVVAVAVGAAIVGMPLGLWVLSHLGNRALTAAIGVVVLVLTVALIRGLRLPAGRATYALAGVLSGALSTSTGTSGPPLVIALQGIQVAAEGFRATLATLFALQGTVAFGAFIATGRVTAEVGRVALAGLPGLATGWVLGDRIFRRLDERRFRRLVTGMLALSATVAIIRSLVA